MKRFIFWPLLGAALFGLVFFGLNLFDSRPDPAMAKPQALAAQPGARQRLFSALGFCRTCCKRPVGAGVPRPGAGTVQRPGTEPSFPLTLRAMAGPTERRFPQKLARGHPLFPQAAGGRRLRVFCPDPRSDRETAAAFRRAAAPLPTGPAGRTTWRTSPPWTGNSLPAVFPWPRTPPGSSPPPGPWPPWTTTGRRPETISSPPWPRGCG